MKKKHEMSTGDNRKKEEGRSYAIDSPVSSLTVKKAPRKYL